MSATNLQSIDLAPVLAELDLSLGAFARAVGLSKGSAHRLVKHGAWPARTVAAAQERVSRLLATKGAAPAHWAAFKAAGLHVGRVLATTSRKAPPMDQIGEAPFDAARCAVPATPGPLVETPEDNMLLECTPLTEQAKKAWSLPRSPFLDDVSSRDDVFASPAMRRVRAALLDCAMHHGFMAVVGESGSGKTTLREDLEQRILDEDRPFIVIKPYTLAMEPNDVKGKQMKSGQIAEAIAHALAPSVTLKSSPEARFRQVHELLRDSVRAGNRHLLVIEEAHRMPLATLKHLKGWMELKDGMRRLLGVCLIGQPELGTRLSETQPEIREVVQRCEKIYMEPLDESLPAYLKLKFDRIGVDVATVLADDAYDALRAKLVQIPRGGTTRDAYSTCYPLVVNNHVARAMNAAAAAGWAKVDAQVIAGS